LKVTPDSKAPARSATTLKVARDEKLVARPVRTTKDHPLAATEAAASCTVASSLPELGASRHESSSATPAKSTGSRKRTKSGSGDSSIVPQAPVVISIDDESEIADPDAVISIDDESVIADPDAVSSTGKAVSASDVREKKISEWLMNVIGFNPDSHVHWTRASLGQHDHCSLQSKARCRNSIGC
jgi:hypothetical protein